MIALVLFDCALRLRLTSDEAYEAYLQKGIAHRELREFTDASEAFRKASQKRPQDPYVYTQLAEVFRNLGKYEEAEAADQKATQLKNNKVPE